MITCLDWYAYRYQKLTILPGHQYAYSARRNVQMIQFTPSAFFAENAVEQRDSNQIDVERGFLLKRKDFLGVDQLAHSHPNRTYYYRKHFDLDEVVATCSKKLQVCNVVSCWVKYLKLCQIDCTNIKALFLRGNALFKKHSYASALADFSSVLNTEPDHVEALYYRGENQCSSMVVMHFTR